MLNWHSNVIKQIQNKVSESKEHFIRLGYVRLLDAAPLVVADSLVSFVTRV